MSDVEQYIIRNSYTPRFQLVANGGFVSMSDSENDDNSLWHFTPAPYFGYFRLHTLANGDTKSLDVNNTNDTSSTGVHLVQTGEYTGQFWRLDSWGDGTYRLSNNFTGPYVYLDLDVASMTPYLRYGDGVAQNWEFINVTDEDTSAVTSSSQAVATSVPAAGTQTLSTTPSSTIFSSANTSSRGKPISVGMIAGIAIGGLAALTLCICAIIYALRRKRTESAPTSAEHFHVSPAEQVDSLPNYVAATSKKGSSSAHVIPQDTQGKYTQESRNTQPVEVAGSAGQNPTEMP